MIPLVDDAAVEAVRARGDVHAIAISHPHYYSGMVEWSEALGDVPVLLHEADREWIMRPDPRIELWSGDVKELGGGLTLLRLGGHYPGGTVLHDANSEHAPLRRHRDGDPGPSASSASCGAIRT